MATESQLQAVRELRVMANRAGTHAGNLLEGLRAAEKRYSAAHHAHLRACAKAGIDPATDLPAREGKRNSRRVILLQGKGGAWYFTAAKGHWCSADYATLDAAIGDAVRKGWAIIHEF